MNFAIVGILSQLLWLLSVINPETPLGDPERVQIVDKIHGKTVSGHQGETLRGATVAVYKFRRDTIGQPGYPSVDYATDPAFWDRMKGAGVNAVRVVCFDAWQRSHGDPDANPFLPYPFASLTIEDALLQGAANVSEAIEIMRSDRAALLADLDTIVELAAQRHMYVMINYHDTTGYRDPDFAAGLPPGQNHFPYMQSTNYLYRFWNRVAPRYADRTHVFYELMNEPVGYHPNDYLNQDVVEIARLHKRVRSLAPNTHLVLASFSTPASFNQRDMLMIGRMLRVRGVDMAGPNANSSIGFHPYDINDALPHNYQPILRAMSEFAVLNTEMGLPESLNFDPNAPRAPGYGNHLLNSQSMERINVGWFAWNTFEQDGFGHVFEDILQQDAVSKGYFLGH